MAQLLDPVLRHRDFLAQPYLPSGTLSLGVPKVIEVFVLMGELVAFQPDLDGQGDDGQFA